MKALEVTRSSSSLVSGFLVGRNFSVEVEGYTTIPIDIPSGILPNIHKRHGDERA